ncbi:MAG: DUF2157 domain-containing protein [Actinomycetales bacterium]|nr:DUF2157 domain-containing protein [Actinomycetales bacterium]
MNATAQTAFEYPAAGMPCPRCNDWLWAGKPTGPVQCRCGYTVDSASVREAVYLRAHLPQWTERLAQLERGFATGEAEGKVPAEAGATPAPVAAASPAAPRVRVSGAYAVLVTLGALLIAAGVLALTVVLWDAAGPLGQAALMATVAVLIAIAAVAIRRRIPATANALAVIAVLVWLAFAVLMARELLGLDLEDAGWTLAFASTAAWTWLAGWRWRLRPWTLGAALATPTAVTFALVMATERIGGSVVLVVAATALGVGAVLLAWRPWGLPTPERVLAGVTAALAALILAISAVAVSQEPPTFISLTFGLLVVAAGCWLVAPLRWAAPPLVGIAVGLTAAFGWSSVWWSAALMAALVCASILVRRVPLAPIAAGTAAVTWLPLAAGEYGDGLPKPWWAFVALFAVASAALAWRAIRDRHVELLVVSAAAGVPAVLWAVALILEGRTGDRAVEWFTGPVALLLLGYGLVAARMRPALPSLVTIGPAVAVALWPSAVAGLADEDPVRLYAVLAVAAVALLVGLVLRLLGVVAPAVVALVLVAMRPLSLLVEWMPSWVAYTVAGAVLVILGARFEHVRSRAVTVRHWAHDYFR